MRTTRNSRTELTTSREEKRREEKEERTAGVLSFSEDKTIHPYFLCCVCSSGPAFQWTHYVGRPVLLKGIVSSPSLYFTFSRTLRALFFPIHVKKLPVISWHAFSETFTETSTEVLQRLLQRDFLWKKDTRFYSKEQDGSKVSKKVVVLSEEEDGKSNLRESQSKISQEKRERNN